MIAKMLFFIIRDPKIKTKCRPKHKKSTIEKVWENAKDGNGKVYDPYTD